VLVLNLNNMRDEASDRKVGKNTLVVKIGGKKAKLYHYFSNFCNGFDGSVCD
jgi:1,4-dihydroxy-2-naphthoate octaprenyltransferase